MNQTIPPPPPKGYRIITEDERKALVEASKVIAEAQFYYPKTRQWICGGCSFLSTTFTYAIRYDEWIPWAGNAYCPLPVGTIIDVRYRDGTTRKTHVYDLTVDSKKASLLGTWSKPDADDSITAYRVHEPEQANEMLDGLKSGMTINHTNTGWDLASGPDLSQQQTNENTMNTQSETPVGSVGCSLPEVGSTWVYRCYGDSTQAVVTSANYDNITVMRKGDKNHRLHTISEWQAYPKTRIYTRKELKQMAKQNRPGNIIVKTGGSRKRWFLIGAAAMYVGKPFIPAAAYHVMQFINSIL